MPVPSTVRHINQSRLLQALQKKGPLSRADISRELDVMRSTAGNLVATLMQEGLIREIGESNGPSDQPRVVGRPGTLVELNPDHATFLGAEVGIGYVRLVSVDMQGQVTASLRAEVALERQTPEATVEAVADLVAQITRGPITAPVHGLCISIPGLMNLDGTVLRVPILGWRNVPFLGLLRDRLPQIPLIEGENEANAFAIAELLDQDDPIDDDAIFVWLDAGVGGAIRAEGRVVRGHHGFAGEFGHMYVGTSLIKTKTLIEGSLESAVGRAATLARYHELGGAAPRLDALLAGHDNKEGPALQTAQEWSSAMARALSIMINIFDPGQIIFGGALAAFAEKCLEAIQTNVSELLLDASLVPRLTISKSGAEGAAVGSALMLHHAYLDIDEDLVFGGERANAL